MLFLTLANERQRRQIQHEGGAIELGRGPERDLPRVVVEDRFTSRDQLSLEELPTGQVRLRNFGNTVTLSDGVTLAAGETRDLTPPTRITFGYSTLDIGMVPRDEGYDSSLQSLARPARIAKAEHAQAKLSELGESPSAQTLAAWFEALLSVQRAAAGSGEFYTETARAVVQLIGLDRGMVLLKSGSDWQISAQHSPDGRLASQFSRRVLRQVEVERRTVFQSFEEDGGAQSLMGIEAVVASPIFDEHDKVVGAVYGSRDLRTLAGKRGVQPLEAQFVQLLAGAVSAGLTRLAREAEAARARVQFEQFFSPELAGALQRDSGILAAQERELTLLFADLRGFSRMSERIGTRETYNLLSDILDRLTNQIMDHGGVVIDYYGDGLAAMWNAPADEPNHAQRAAEAALAMLGELPRLNEAWAERLGGAIRLGVGLNTGLSQVGNAGSNRRLKYGPRGHAVNLTSRVETATKLLGVACLVTESTQRRLPSTLKTRRLCRARLSGIVEPVNLYELCASPPSAEWTQLCETYELALSLFEADQPQESLDRCDALLQSLAATDAATNLLRQRALARLANPSQSLDPVFTLETK